MLTRNDQREQLANVLDGAVRALSTTRKIDTAALTAELWHIAADRQPKDLAPITEVRAVDAKPFPAMFVITIGMTTHKARTLLRWAELYDVLDMIAGKHHENDPVLRLNVRGVAGHTPVCVVCQFDENADRDLVRLINSSITATTPRELIDQLARAEGLEER